MLSRIIELFRSHGLMEEVEDQVHQMFWIAKDLFTSSTEALLDQKIPEFDLYARDREINLLQVEVKEKIVNHLAVAGLKNVSGCLYFLEVTTDIERVGDYSKNIMDLVNRLPAPLPESPYFKQLKELYPIVAGFFGKAEKALFEGDEEAASQVIAQHLEVIKGSRAIQAGLMQETEIPPPNAIAFALAARYFKRVGAHLKNVATTAIHPYSHLGYMSKPEVSKPPAD